VDRVGLDLERLGKAERQSGLGTWISPHHRSRLTAVGRALSRAQLFARTEPWRDGTQEEVDGLIADGARVLMLPMFTGPEEVERFVAAVAGRATVVLLLETREAAQAAHEIAAVPGADEVHVGLNDLTLSLGLPNRFLTLASGTLDEVAAAVLAAGKPLGVGGLGRPGDTGLPIPADLVYAALAHLGATRALLSRSFFRADDELGPEAVEAVRTHLAAWRERPATELLDARRALRERALASTVW